MVEGAERLINLAMFLASAQGTVTAEDIRREVYGYPQDQDEAAFKRMLERDKDALRSSGFAIECDDEGNYRLDKSATYVGPVSLTPDETAAVTAVAMALGNDASFPFSEDLRLALTKISSQMTDVRPQASSRLADEEPVKQGEAVAELSTALNLRKRASFGYTNSAGASAPHEVEPFGLFLHGGRWYLVARDISKDETRTYAVTRIDHLACNTSAPKTPDFERPQGFDVSTFVRMPFQYGAKSDEFDASIEMSGACASGAARVAINGEMVEQADGTVLWHVKARNSTALARYVIENGPGMSLKSPPEAITILLRGLADVEALHG